MIVPTISPRHENARCSGMTVFGRFGSNSPWAGAFSFSTNAFRVTAGKLHQSLIRTQSPIRMFGDPLRAMFGSGRPRAASPPILCAHCFLPRTELP